MNTLAINCGAMQRNQGTGFLVSILTHLLIVVVLLYATSQIQAAPKIMVVDFSIIESPVQKKTSPQITKQQVAPAPSVVKPPEKIISPPKLRPKKKVAKKIVKPLSLQKSIIAAIKPKPVPPPEPEVIQAAEIAPVAEVPPPAPPQLAEEATPLVDNRAPASTPVASTLKSLPHFPAPAAGKARTNKDQTTVSKYTKNQFNHIRQGIQRQINYPRTARRMGWEGKVVVEFIVCKDGSVKNINIVESSGINALDKNAVATIKKAAPFPNPPIPAKLIIPVVYRLI